MTSSPPTPTLVYRFVCPIRWDWVGLQAHGYGAYESKITVMKLECLGAIFAVVGAKCEVPLVHMQTSVNKMHTTGLAVFGWATRIKFGALKATMGPETKL